MSPPDGDRKRALTASPRARPGTVTATPGKQTRTATGGSAATVAPGSRHDGPGGGTAAAQIQRRTDGGTTAGQIQRKAASGTQASGASTASAPRAAASTNAGQDADPASAAHAAAARGIAGTSHVLPHGDRIERLFGGHDVSRIQAHTDASAAAGARSMGAQAFATGDHVAFATAPDLHTAAHEAAHVVQQRAGVQLPGGVGQSGDAHERNADAVADRVVQGLPAHDLLPAPAEVSAATTSGIQRQDGPQMTPAQVQAAIEWAATNHIGVEAIREVQRVCGIAQTGLYDQATAQAVFAKQKELGLGTDGKADDTFFQRNGIILTHAIITANVSDPVLDSVAKTFPDGVTIAIYAKYNPDKASDWMEFENQATEFAANHTAVSVSGGQVVLGQPCPIHRLGDVIEVVQSIHRGLLQKWDSSRPRGAHGGQGADPAQPPAYTRVKNLALFSHGESYGMGLNEDKDFWGDGLHTDDNPGVAPSNVEAFVRGLSDAVVPGIRVLLYGCAAGLGKGTDTKQRSEGAEWGLQDPGDRAGIGSLADSLAQGFGPGSTVMAHTTVGHVTSNYAARVFGAEAGGGPGGISVFEDMYPETYVQSELVRLFRDLSDADRAARHDSLRWQMWEHYKDSLWGAGKARYRELIDAVDPMGQEVFIDPDNARTLLHNDWETNWIPQHIKQVTPQ